MKNKTSFSFACLQKQSLYNIHFLSFSIKKTPPSNLNDETTVAQAHGQNNNTSKKKTPSRKENTSKRLRYFVVVSSKGGESLRIGEFLFLQLQPTVSRASRIFQLEWHNHLGAGVEPGTP